jgi:hypothetical protein
MTESLKPAHPDVARSARLRDALRENLKRRKSQARARAVQVTVQVTDLTMDGPEPTGSEAKEDATATKL